MDGRELHEMAGAWLTVDLSALVGNYRAIARQSAARRVAAVVKADAYGLGVAEVAPALARAGCRDFFVAHLAEVPPLRAALADAGVAGEAALYVLNGLMPGAEPLCRALGAIPVLNSLDQARRWAALAPPGRRAPAAALQIDSGMRRLGLSHDEVDALLADPALDRIDCVLVMSHLACGSEPGAASNAAQHACFDALAARFPGVPRSLANSGGSLLPLAAGSDLARPGIALYGGAPHEGESNPMHAVVRLDARVIQLRDVPAGLGVGYGLEGAADRPRRLATLSVGYADGWPRGLGGRGAAYRGATRLPIVGRISMDSMIVDVTALGDAAPREGETVELLGDHQGIDAVAGEAGTIAYELLTRLGHRYHRTYLPDTAAAAGMRTTEDAA